MTLALAEAVKSTKIAMELVQHKLIVLRIKYIKGMPVLERRSRKKPFFWCNKTILVLFLLLFSSAIYAQNRGTLQVIKNPLIDTLIARRLALSKQPNVVTAVFSYGFRVQFYSGSDRKEAYREQAKFNELYPEHSTYIIYAEPNYKVRAGDFRTRLEAQKLVHNLRPDFPSLFIISEKINPLKLENNVEN
ncbi:MAG: SPOR domain-containing protein [Sphingobacteriaceae bacterium]